MKKLSIIIPVYNVEKYLRKCLDSAIDPSSEDYEIITVNDGSTDTSADILDEYAKKYPGLIRVITKENGGLGSARNAAIGPAEGEFLYFLDSDDSLSPNAVAEMLDTLRSSTFDICLFDAAAFNEAGKKLEDISGGSKEGSFRFEESPDILLRRMNVGTKIFRRTLFTENGIRFRDREWYEDMSCVPILYALADRIFYRKSAWYNYLTRQGSIMNSGTLARNLEIISAVEATNSYYREHGLFEKYHNELEYMCFYNVLIAATVRVNLVDPDTPLQDRLLEYFTEAFPNYRQNPYVKAAPAKYRLLDQLITARKHRAIHLLMTINDRVKH